jgi:Holliday junction resolvase RusA-like endonuclease
MSRTRHRRVEFEIPGRPAPKGSRATGRRKDGSVFTYEQNKRVGPWMKLAQELLAGNPELSPPYHLHVVFVYERPKKSKYDYPAQGDLDKCVRSLCDALEASGIVQNDKFVLRIDAEKFFGPKEMTRGYVEEA